MWANETFLLPAISDPIPQPTSTRSTMTSSSISQSITRKRLLIKEREINFTK